MNLYLDEIKPIISERVIIDPDATAILTLTGDFYPVPARVCFTIHAIDEEDTGPSMEYFTKVVKPIIEPHLIAMSVDLAILQARLNKTAGEGELKELEGEALEEDWEQLRQASEDYEKRMATKGIVTPLMKILQANPYLDITGLLGSFNQDADDKLKRDGETK